MVGLKPFHKEPLRQWNRCSSLLWRWMHAWSLGARLRHTTTDWRSPASLMTIVAPIHETHDVLVGWSISHVHIKTASTYVAFHTCRIVLWYSVGIIRSQPRRRITPIIGTNVEDLFARLARWAARNSDSRTGHANASGDRGTHWPPACWAVVNSPAPCKAHNHQGFGSKSAQANAQMTTSDFICAFNTA